MAGNIDQMEKIHKEIVDLLVVNIVNYLTSTIKTAHKLLEHRSEEGLDCPPGPLDLFAEDITKRAYSIIEHYPENELIKLMYR